MSGTYLQPESLEELSGLLASLPERTFVLAGGTDLMPMLRAKHPEYDCMLSLWRIAELRVVQEQDGWLKVGAMATHAAVAASPDVARDFQALQMACAHVGSQQIRNKGTLGGSLVNASPAGDILPCMLLYGGEVELLGKDGTRRLPAGQFIGPNGKPDLRRGEVLTFLWLPIQPGLQSCFVKLGSRTEVTIAQISMCVAWNTEDGRTAVQRAYVGAVDRKPMPFPGLSLLERAESAEDAANALAAEIKRIRQNRSRPSKLKITEGEQFYKERAAKGVVYDVMTAMGVLSNQLEPDMDS